MECAFVNRQGEGATIYSEALLDHLILMDTPQAGENGLQAGPSELAWARCLRCICSLGEVRREALMFKKLSILLVHRRLVNGQHSGLEGENSSEILILHRHFVLA